MRITMVKKRLAGGSACDKCVQADELLRNRGLSGRIDEVVWADDGDASSPGTALATRWGIDVAPFFVVADSAGQERVYTSVLQFIGDTLKMEHRNDSVPGQPNPHAAARDVTEEQFKDWVERVEALSPQEAVNFALSKYGHDCAISFSGAEDVVLIELAARSGQPFSVFSLDTGRLHPETYEFIERVREHYGIHIDVYAPEATAVQALVREKGLFSFYADGHQECCSIRKVEPLRRALSHYRMWVTGQRRDQSPTRSNVEVLQVDPVFSGVDGSLLKLNPLAKMTLTEIWTFIRQANVPYNALHDHGFISIGCAPCTRAVRPGEHERAGRWSWEDATKRECGLHVTTPTNYSI